MYAILRAGSVTATTLDDQRYAPAMAHGVRDRRASRSARDAFDALAKPDPALAFPSAYDDRLRPGPPGRHGRVWLGRRGRDREGQAVAVLIVPYDAVSLACAPAACTARERLSRS
jgi:hypothetical protein